MLNLKLLKNVCGRTKVIVVTLPPKNNIYKNDINTKWFFLNDEYTIINGENLYLELQEYWNNDRCEEKLKYIHTLMIDIDIWEDKECKTNHQLFEKLELLKTENNLIPHYIIKTKHWYHIHFLFKKLNYKKSWKKIEAVYEYIRDSLYGDKQYKWKTWLWKIPGTLDFSVDDKDYAHKLNAGEIDYDTPFTIYCEKINDHKKYDTQKIYEIFTQINNINKNTTSELIQLDEAKQEKLYKIHKTLVKEANDKCAKEVLEKLWVGVINWKILSDNSLSLFINKNTKKYSLHDFSWKVFWNFNFVLRYCQDLDRQNAYKNTLKFFNADFWIKRVDSINYIIIKKFIFNHILRGKFIFDIQAFKKDHPNDFDKILCKKDIINDEWILSNTIVFILLNILWKNSNWELKNVNFHTIFDESYMKYGNINAQKDLFLEYMEIMKYLYIETEKYEYIDPNEYKWYLDNNLVHQNNDNIITDDEIIEDEEEYDDILDTSYESKISKFENQEIIEERDIKKEENPKKERKKYTRTLKLKWQTKFYLLNSIKEIKSNTYDITILKWLKALGNEENNHSYYIPRSYLKKDKRFMKILLFLLNIYNKWNKKWEIFYVDEICKLLDMTYNPIPGDIKRNYEYLRKTISRIKNDNLLELTDIVSNINISCFKDAKNIIKIIKTNKKAFQIDL